MKKQLTLAAFTLLAAASLPAQAQFTVDGTASTAEIGTGINKYQQVATYTGTHSDADRGIKSLYVGYTATTLNLMLVGSGEAATAGPYKAFVLYLNVPGRTGIAVGTQLPGSGDGLSPLKHKPTMDMEVDFGLRVSIGPGGTDVYFSRASYVTSPANDVYLGQGSKSGTAVTAAATTDFAGAKLAYNNTASLAANTTNTGWEVEIPLAVLGTLTSPVTVGSRVDLFAAYTDGDGIFTSDVLPAVSGRTTALGADPNFRTIAGTQALAYVIGTGLLSNRDVAEYLKFGVYPNPSTGAVQISYQVPAGQQEVQVEVFNSLGQLVQQLNPGRQSGSQLQPLQDLRAGSYFVKLRVGKQTTARQLAVL